jgi:hypothetical protein
MRITAEKKEGKNERPVAERAVWHNSGCTSLDSATRQQVKWLVANAGSPPLRKAATTLAAIAGQRVRNRNGQRMKYKQIINSNKII